MALNATTLSAAIGASDTTIQVASVTGITVPNFTSGVGITYLLVEAELMLVTGVAGLFVSVQRGQLGSSADPHGVTAAVVSGVPSDFTNFAPVIFGFGVAQQGFQGWAAPVASAATIVASGTRFHITGTTTVNTITPPAGYVEGDPIYVVVDGALAFGTSGNIAVATTATAMAGKMLTLVYDAGTSKWYNSGPVA